MPADDFQYDATIGKNGFTALDSELRSLPADAVSVPNSAAAAIAIAALGVARFAGEPGMVTVVAYHLANDPDVSRTFADIRAGVASLSGPGRALFGRQQARPRRRLPSASWR